MTVAELILFLQKQPQDLLVVYSIHSEYCLLEESEIETGELCQPRPDGWVHNRRFDKPKITYLVFP